jgi:hypothetical protein
LKGKFALITGEENTENMANVDPEIILFLEGPKAPRTPVPLRIPIEDSTYIQAACVDYGSKREYGKWR